MKWEQKREGKKMLVKKSGFTLIELVMVIIILGIFSSIMLPKFLNFKAKAQINSDEAVMGALRVAVQTVHLSYVTHGMEDSWPGLAGWNDCPLSYLSPIPPFEQIGFNQAITSNSVMWHLICRGDWNYTWEILCPHFQGSYTTGPVATKGKWWEYQPTKFWNWSWLDVQAGDLFPWPWGDFGH